MSSSSCTLTHAVCAPRPEVSTSYRSCRCSLKTTQWDLEKRLRRVSQAVLNAFVDRTFRFQKQPLLPSQRNYAPVDEIGEAVVVTSIEGQIPLDFPEGVYIRNGGNPAFGAMLSTVSIFGASSESWLEGEGMLHAVYFGKDDQGNWILRYKNKYVETETFNFENQRKKPFILPIIEGEPSAILANALLNELRFGQPSKQFCNTNIIEHAGRIFATSENNLPYEIDISTLQTCEKWDVNKTWKRRGFTSHPKRVPATGELVIMGVDVLKPYFTLGIISGKLMMGKFISTAYGRSFSDAISEKNEADGEKIKHEVDLEFERSILCHDMGITERYNVILDVPMVVSLERLLQGDTLIKFEDDSYSRIGVMPRYGDAKSVKWFQVETYCTFHLLNCYEDDDEVVVMGISVHGRSILGPKFGRNKNEWYSNAFRSAQDGLIGARLYEWRLNMKTGGVKERFLTGTDIPIEFPVINEAFCGLRNKYAYVQNIDPVASSYAAMTLFGGLSKLYLDGSSTTDNSKLKSDQNNWIKKEVHQLEKNHFCSGASFVPRKDGCGEDDGWIITFVHDELSNISQVHIIDCKKFASAPVAKITLPARVPYGFHGNYFLADRLRTM